MPSRSARCRFAILAALATTLAPAAKSQELQFPADSAAEATAPPTPTAVSDRDTSYQSLQNDAFASGDIGFVSSGGGAYYNSTLGAHLRAAYRTRSYGQQEGTFNLGTMKMLEMDNGVAFLDGQVTMNDDSGVGYNLGAGYRWMTLPVFPWSPDDAKIAGVSIWSDGQTIAQENFFPQVGVSVELLGEQIDFRANAYIPVGNDTQTRDFQQTGGLSFSGNSVANLLQGVQDTALTSGDAEVAGRLGNLDAWAFAGVYALDGEGVDAFGGKLGLRGYATPDLLLSIALANDDEFDTNALFSATWFIGRTRAENCPVGVLADRYREPVLRNNYVATQQSVAFSTGAPLQDANLQDIRVVHVDSTAGAGGDGSFESPLNTLDAINGASQAGDIVLAHAGSDFNDQTANLLDNQTFFGEGGGMALSVPVAGGATIDLPETAPGASALARPTIAGAAGAAGVVLADNNVVQNLTFDGGQNAVINAALGSLNPTLRDIDVTGTTGDAFALNTVIGADVDDLDNDGDVAETTNFLGAITIEDIAFNNIGGRDIAIDGDRAAAEAADATINSPIVINRVTSTGNASNGPSLAISNTVAQAGSASTITIDDYNYTGGANSGGLEFENTGGDATVTNSSFTGGAAPALAANANTGTITLGTTNTIADIAGDAVTVNENTGAVSVGADITTDAAITGGTVRVTNNQATVTASGDITANGVDAVAVLNAQSNVLIGSTGGVGGTPTTLTHTGAGAAVRVTDDGTVAATSTQSDGVTINSDITNTGGNSVVVEGQGVNRINDVVQFTGEITDTGEGIRITNVDQNLANVGAPAGSEQANVEFLDRVNVDTTAAGGGDAIVITGNAADAIVSFEELDITTTTGTALASDGGELNVTGTDGATPPTFTSSITTGSGQAIDITGGSSTGGVSFATVNTTNPLNAVEVANFDGTVTINGGTLNATGQAVTFTNAAFALDDVTINSGSPNAIQATFNDNIDRTVSATNITASGGDLNFNSSGSGAITATWADVGGAGLARYLNSGTGNDTLTVTDSAFATGFDYDATNSGGLAVTMNTDDGALTGGAVNFFTSGSNSSSLTVNDLASTGGFAFNDTGSGGLAILATDSSAVGDVAYNVNGAGVSTIGLNNVNTTGGFQYNLDGDGNLAATMTNVNSTGADTPATIAATASNTSTGALSLNVSDSGDTNAFTGLTFNQQGSGAATATFTNVESTSGIDFDSASDSTSTLTVTGGNFGGDINAAETGDGSLTTTLTNIGSAGAVAVTEAGDGAAILTTTGGSFTGGVTIAETGDGAATLTMNGGDFGGGITFNEAGAGNATAGLTNVTSTGGVEFDAAAAGTDSFTVTGGSFGGPILGDTAAGSTGDFTASVTGGTTFTSNGQIALNALNAGEVDYTLSGLTFNTGANVDAISLSLSSATTTGGVNVSGNAGVQTLDGSVLDLTIGGGTVNYLLANNTFTNNSASGTVNVVNQSGATLNANINNNTLTNSGAGDALTYTNEIASTTNLLVTANGQAGVDYNFTNNAAVGNFTIGGPDAVSVDAANPANVTFINPVTFDNNLVLPAFPSP